jgi:oligopeptide transport system substrate-binding protein
LTVPPVDPLITRYLQAQWQENLSIQVTWEVADLPQFQQRLQQDPPHLCILAGFAQVPDPGDLVTADWARTYTRWASEAYGALLEKARQVLDQGERLELLRQADQILIREAAIVPLFYGRQHVLVKPWVSSFPISPLNHWYCKDTILEPH